MTEVNLTNRPLGRVEVEYGGYRGTLLAKIKDHDLGHEETPRYELSIRLKGSDFVCDSVNRALGASVWYTEDVGLAGWLRGERPEEKRRPLTPLVEALLEKAFTEIDEMAAGAGLPHGDEDKSPAEEAKRVVSELDFQEVGHDEQ